MRLPLATPHALSLRSICSLTLTTALLLSFAPPKAAAQTGQISCNPRNVRFGTMALKQSEIVPVVLTNSGSSSVTITAVGATIPEFGVTGLTLPFTVAAGASATVDLTFTPTVSGWAEGTMSFTSNASNGTLYVGVGGVGVANESMTPSPSILAFGNVMVGKTSTLPVSLTNSGETNIRMTQMAVTGVGFTISGLNLPMVLAPNQMVSFDVIFAPLSGGSASGTIALPNGGVTVPLNGTGLGVTGQLSIAPAPLNFGDVTVGNTGTQAVNLSASGGSVTITSAASSSSLFALNGVTFPFTIAAGGSVSLNVGFTPQTSGPASGSLSLASNASNAPGPESLTGTGMPAAYTVNLSWNGSQNVVGYNVYRSIAANGTYAKINTTVDPITTYADGSVTSGQTYYYAATSVNASGQESARSSPPVQAVVP